MKFELNNQVEYNEHEESFTLWLKPEMAADFAILLRVFEQSYTYIPESNEYTVIIIGEDVLRFMEEQNLIYFDVNVENYPIDWSDYIQIWKR